MHSKWEQSWALEPPDSTVLVHSPQILGGVSAGLRNAWFLPRLRREAEVRPGSRVSLGGFLGDAGERSPGGRLGQGVAASEKSVWCIVVQIILMSLRVKSWIHEERGFEGVRAGNPIIGGRAPPGPAPG